LQPLRSFDGIDTARRLARFEAETPNQTGWIRAIVETSDACHHL